MAKKQKGSGFTEIGVLYKKDKAEARLLIDPHNYILRWRGTDKASYRDNFFSTLPALFSELYQRLIKHRLLRKKGGDALLAVREAAIEAREDLLGAIAEYTGDRKAALLAESVKSREGHEINAK